jgi:hypothetical protein
VALEVSTSAKIDEGHNVPFEAGQGNGGSRGRRIGEWKDGGEGKASASVVSAGARPNEASHDPDSVQTSVLAAPQLY